MKTMIQPNLTKEAYNITVKDPEMFVNGRIKPARVAEVLINKNDLTSMYMLTHTKDSHFKHCPQMLETKNELLSMLKEKPELSGVLGLKVA